MKIEAQKPVDQIVKILMDTSTHIFKFHGEVAMQLFLNDEFKLPNKVDICVERKKLIEILKVIPKDFTIEYYSKANIVPQSKNFHYLKLPMSKCLKMEIWFSIFLFMM